MKTIVITGSTKGIGFAMAGCFLDKGCRVVVSGRRQEPLDAAVAELSARHGSERVAGFLCDVTIPEQVEALWQQSVARFGRIDIWINNAGSGHPQLPIWELDDQTVRSVINSNVVGVINCCRVAIPGLLAQGGGQIYNFEGFGSNGRVRAGIGVYGASKSAVTFLSKTLAAELKDTPVQVGTIQPGMVLTDLVLDQYKDDPEGLENAKKIFNIIASPLDEVAPALVEKVLANDKNGASLEYLSRVGLYLRFLKAPFSKRNLFED
ncbi:MAG: SDR family oxidoreductase [Caldilineales bacterium]